LTIDFSSSTHRSGVSARFLLGFLVSALDAFSRFSAFALPGLLGTANLYRGKAEPSPTPLFFLFGVPAQARVLYSFHP